MKKKNSVENLARAHVFYNGHVQGIGFRYTAERLALELGLVGWVKNIADGRVEIVCEGPRETLELFLKKIAESPLGPHIKKRVCEWETPTHEFGDFSIEFCL
ncbi:MAG: acylphosphatase [Candidatus Omnitrophica bacterium]|nr:acylphosphatase [Candidatus Omnitrophota bacterium]